MTPPGASAGRKSPKTFLTVDPRGRPYAKRQIKRQAWPPTRVGVPWYGDSVLALYERHRLDLVELRHFCMYPPF